MPRECRERFPRHRLQRKPLVSDPAMHHGTFEMHVPWCMSGSLTRIKTFPAFPARAQPAILRIWQEAHGSKRATWCAMITDEISLCAQNDTVWSGKTITENNLRIFIYKYHQWNQFESCCCEAMLFKYSDGAALQCIIRANFIIQQGKHVNIRYFTIKSYDLTHDYTYQPYLTWIIGSTRSMLASVCITAFHICFHIHVFIFAEKVTSL